MLLTAMLSLHTVMATSGMGPVNCDLSAPPDNAGETQAHGVILYIYPRSHIINKNYNGCQNMWFYDDSHYRKLSVVHYKHGIAIAYDNINLNGEIGYYCEFEKHSLIPDSDKRCPQYDQLKKKTYRTGCYSLSKLNSSGSYDITTADCVLE